MTDENHIKMNAVTVETLSDQIVAIAGKMEHLSHEHRGTLVQVSGILHTVLLELALFDPHKPADKPVEASVQAKDPVQTARSNVNVSMLRGKIGREPNEYDISICHQIGYPEFQVTQPVWLLENGDKLKATIVGVKAFHDHMGPHWKFKVTQSDDLFLASDLRAITQ